MPTADNQRADSESCVKLFAPLYAIENRIYADLKPRVALNENLNSVVRVRVHQDQAERCGKDLLLLVLRPCKCAPMADLS